MQRIDTGARVGNNHAVEGRAVGHIGGIGWGEIPQTDIDSVLIADIFDGQGVPQSFAGHQNVGVPLHDGGDFQHLEGRCRGNQRLGGVLVSGHVGIITVKRTGASDNKLGLVEHHGAAGDHRRQPDLEYHLNRVVGVTLSADAEIADIHQARALRAAQSIGPGGVRTRGYADQIEAPGSEGRCTVETVHLVYNGKGRQSHRAGVADLDGVAQGVAGAGVAARILAGGYVAHEFEESQNRRFGGDGVSVLMVKGPRRAVGQCAGIGARRSIQHSGVGAEPLGNPGDIGQCDSVFGGRIQLEVVADDQPLIRCQAAGR